MLYSTLKMVLLPTNIVLIGDMVFARYFLHPAAASLPPPDQVRLMHVVMCRFFNMVLMADRLALDSGLCWVPVNSGVGVAIFAVTLVGSSC
jgi:hypothetical protein